MYILFTGAPGSKWSSVVKNIYWSDDIDHSDYSEERRYFHDADTPGRKHLMHIGAYWDPDMEFENTNWDGPFSGKGKRIVKSHTFAHQLDVLKQSGHPIVMVYRNDYECLEWWKLCGEFNITYPNYKHFKNLDEMWVHIQNENKDMMQFIKDNKDKIHKPKDNVDLCRLLEISFPDTKGRIHNYADKGVQVYVYK
jgi:hypothetical protein|tara:strand:+ start:22 stop:606 length:585 start_codon:yes stop_codon:yes gene_type:complete